MTPAGRHDGPPPPPERCRDLDPGASEQPVGAPIPGWTPRPAPTADVLEGRWCRLESLDADAHAADLFEAFREPSGWTYLPYGPFQDRDAHRAWVESSAASRDTWFFAIVVDDVAVGVLSLLRMQGDAGSIEVGHVHYGTELRRRPAATEAQYLLMRHVFDDLGYRRYEWKCDALNAPSRAAAERLGFTYEGTFRQAIVVKGRNRDTAWFSALDGEWPRLRSAFETWLSPGNFDADGAQRRPLDARPHPG